MNNTETSNVDREKVCPFLLRVFCSTSRHNPVIEYSKGKVPPNELQVYTWMDATLKEITSLIREINPDARKKGTCFDFSVVYSNNNRGNHNGFSSRSIGTTVSGQKGPDDSKSLSQCRFIIGDFMDVAVSPPAIDRSNYGNKHEKRYRHY